jgi:hypothetical protein
VKRLGFALILVSCAYSANAQPNKLQGQQQCDSGDANACRSLASSACDGLTAADPATEHLKCQRRAQCYMNLTILLKTTSPLAPGTAAMCEEQNNGGLAPLATAGIFVSWVPATSSTFDQLSPGNLIGGALPPGHQIPAGVDVWDVPEYPYDYDNHTYLYVCQAHIKNTNTGDIATVPGKVLNKNCNVVFEGEFLVANQYEVAMLGSVQHGYWVPIPADGDLSNYLKSAPGPDGKAYTVCSAKISTDTTFIQNPIDSGVHWHGHHIGALDSSNECVVEWGGNPNTSTTDVRVYFVGPPPVFVLPALPAWYTVNHPVPGQPL